MEADPKGFRLFLMEDIVTRPDGWNLGSNKAMKALNRTTQSKDNKMYNLGHYMTNEEDINYCDGLRRISHIVWEVDVKADHSNYATRRDMKRMSNFFRYHQEVWVLASRSEKIKQELLKILKKSRSSEIIGFCVDPGPIVAKYQDTYYEKLIRKEKIYAEKARA